LGADVVDGGVNFSLDPVPPRAWNCFSFCRDAR
jgi:hypothetical protein